MSAAQETVKQARMIHGIFLLTIALYAFTGEMIGRSEVGTETLQWIRIGFFAVAAYNIFLAKVFRKRMISSSLEALNRDPTKSEALKNWQDGNFVTFCFCEVVALLGLGLRFFGGTLMEASLYYVTAAALLILWAPRAEFVREM